MFNSETKILLKTIRPLYKARVKAKTNLRSPNIYQDLESYI